MNDQFIGIVIAIAIGGIVLGNILWRLVAYWTSGPEYVNEGIGLTYEKGAAYPWPGMNEALVAIHEILRQDPWTQPHYEQLRYFNIRIVPYGGIVKGAFVLTGYISLDGTQDVPPPAMGTTNYDARKVTGTIDYQQALPLMPKRRWVIVRQLKVDNDRLDDLFARGKGRVLPVGNSALFYEVARRYVPWVLVGNPKDTTTMDKQTRLLAAMTDRYQELVSR